jgi:hypothetical protein
VFQQGVQVGGEGVVVVAGSRLAGLAEPAPVIGDHPVPGVQQHRDLLVPGPAAERVPVDQHHRLAGAVILVVDLDVGAVFPADGDCGHETSFPWTATRRPQAADQEPGGFACKLVLKPRSRSRRCIAPVQTLAGARVGGRPASLRPRRCGGARGPRRRMPDVRSISPPPHRTDVGRGHRDPRAPRPTHRPGHGPGVCTGASDLRRTRRWKPGLLRQPGHPSALSGRSIAI